MKIDGWYIIVICFFLLPFSCYGFYSEEKFSSDIHYADSLYNLADSLLNNAEYEASHKLFEQAQEIFEREEEYYLYTSCLINRVKVLHNLRKIQEAEELLDKAEDAFWKHNLSRSDTLYSNYLNRKGYSQIIHNDLTEATTCYLESVRIREEKNIDDYSLSYAYNNLGYIYNILGDLTRAEKYFYKTLEIRKEILDPFDPRLARTYSTVGAFLIKLARYERAEEYLDLARNMYIKKYGENYFELGRLYNNLGIIYFNTGEYSKAENFYNKAIQLLDNNTGRYPNDLSRAYNNLGLVYFETNDSNMALEWFFKNVGFIKKKSPSELGRAYIKIANTYNKLGSYDLAERYFEKAVDNIIQYQGQYHFNLATAYLNFGLFYTENKQYKKGLKLYRKALELYNNQYGKKHPNTSRCLYNIADVFKKQNMPDSALYYIQKSLIAVVEDFNDEDISANPSINKAFSNLRLLSSLKTKADLLLDKYKQTHNNIWLEQAFSTLETAVHVIEKVRLEYITEESKLYLAQNEKETYLETIHTALSLFEKTKNEFLKEKAYEYTEKSKSAILLSALRGSEAREFGRIPEKMLREENEIKKDLSIYKEYLFEEKQLKNPDPARITLYQNYVFKLTNRYDSIISVFEQGFPDYYALRFDTQVINPAQVAHSLRRNEALIEYSISDTSLVSFFITRDKFLVNRECIDSIFWMNINHIEESLMESDFSKDVEQEYTGFLNASYNLYQYLVEPFEEHIKKKNLIIIPDEILAYLPFEILLTSKPDFQGANYHSLSYLIKKYPVNYSYSATLLMDNFTRDRFSGTKLLAFAPKYENNIEVEIQSNNIRRPNVGELYPLPFSTEEVKSIEKITNAKIMIDEEATESEFKALAPHFDILHLAMHTIIDDENPMFSKLAFTFAPRDSINDGFLNVNEIYNLKLKAQLAVLSSCNSGTGKLQKGEGIMSIARGFMYAGCPSVVMTLWEVEDNSGSEIMRSFYFYLKRGYFKNKALRLAKLDFLDKATLLKSHPYFWSPYITLGDNSPVYAGLWPGKILPGLLILLLIVIYLRVKKYRKSV